MHLWKSRMASNYTGFPWTIYRNEPFQIVLVNAIHNQHVPELPRNSQSWTILINRSLWWQQSSPWLPGREDGSLQQQTVLTFCSHCIQTFSNGQIGEIRVNKTACVHGGRHDMPQGCCEHRNEVQVTQHPRQAHLSSGHVHCSTCIMAYYILLRTEYYGRSVYTSLMHTALLYNKCFIVFPSMANAVALLTYLFFSVVISNSVWSFGVCLVQQLQPEV